MARARRTQSEWQKAVRRWHSECMSLLLDAWPPSPEPSEPHPRSPRPAWHWLVGVTVGMVAWLILLRPDEVGAYALLIGALALGLAGVWLLTRAPMPGWLISAALIPGLILASSATTYLSAALPIEDAEGIPPINGYILWFGGIWALIAILACSLLTAGRALLSPRGRSDRTRHG